MYDIHRISKYKIAQIIAKLYIFHWGFTCSPVEHANKICKKVRHIHKEIIIVKLLSQGDLKKILD